MNGFWRWCQNVLGNDDEDDMYEDSDLFNDDFMWEDDECTEVYYKEDEEE
jgi:hypothetical protein